MYGTRYQGDQNLVCVLHDIPIFDMQCTPTPRCQRVLFAKFLVPRVEVIYIVRDVCSTHYQGDHNLVCVLTLSTRTVIHNSSYTKTNWLLSSTFTHCTHTHCDTHTHTHMHTHATHTDWTLLDLYSFHLDFKTEIKQVQIM